MKQKELRPLQFIPFYLLWIVSSALTVIDVLMLRTAITAVVAPILDSVPWEKQIEHMWFARFTLPAIDSWFLAIGSIVALSCIISLDYLYRTAIIKNTVKKTFGTITAIQAGIIVICIVTINIVINVVGSA